MAIQRFIFDSFLRYSGSNNKPRFIIPNTGIKAKHCYINNISIPHTFYNINSNNNTVTWVDASAAAQTSVIPVGNYSLSEILTELGTQMTADTSDGLTYTATVNSKTSKTTITNSGPSVFSFTYNASVGCPCFLTLLGFFEVESEQQFLGDYNRIAALTGASSYTSNSSYFVSIRNIYIKSNLARQAVNYNSFSYTYRNSGINDIIANIPVTSSYGDLLTQEAPNHIIKYDIKNSNITELEFELVSDDSYKTIDLNGRAWTIEVIFFE